MSNLSARQYNIVFASHTFMGSPFVVGSHHLARELSHLGHNVAHLSTSITIGHIFRSRFNEDRLRFDIWRNGGVRHPSGVQEFIAMSAVPWPIARRCSIAGVNPYLMSLPSISSLFRAAGFHNIDFLLVDQPRFAGIRQLLHPRRMIYRATDHYGDKTGDKSIVGSELKLARSAEGLVATADLVLDHLKSLDPEKPTLLLENGVEFEHFAKEATLPEEYWGRTAPRAVYAGALDDRFDFAAINTLAKATPEVEFYLIGPGESLGRQLIDAHNVYFLGARPYSSLPSYLQHATVGLLPMNDHPANSGRSPMKLYEYAAAGLPVVARATPELNRRGEPHVHLYQSHVGLAEVFRQVLTRSSSQAAIRQTAEPYSWATKAKQLLRFCEGLG